MFTNLSCCSYLVHLSVRAVAAFCNSCDNNAFATRIHALLLTACVYMGYGELPLSKVAFAQFVPLLTKTPHAHLQCLQRM